METERTRLIRQINLQLAALGEQPCFDAHSDDVAIADFLLANHVIYSKQPRYICPADQRIQLYLDQYFQRHGIAETVNLPVGTYVLGKQGMAAELSLPVDGDKFSSGHIHSYRVRQGVLHNPVNDRRTTKGVFHIVEGGLSIPHDKKAVPVSCFHAMLGVAVSPPRELLRLPFSCNQEIPAKLWVSLLLRPIISPGIPGFSEEKTMEVRFFAPGGLVANLDFIERIFGNAGNPYKPENDAALDIDHWSGHSGCVILAPQLTETTKKQLGLPHESMATERQRREGMCWQQEDELYNDGEAFKVTCRDRNGVIVTIIADNYFGYSKKEIKSQISYAANLYGGCEEEHSGAALAFASYNLGDQFDMDSRIRNDGQTLENTLSVLGNQVDPQDEGYAIDRNYRDIIYLPNDAHLDLYDQRVTWRWQGRERQIKLLLGHTYILPCGYKIHMERHPHAPSWRLIGTEAEGTLCHKPSTVSGAGKSEISKSISDAILGGSLYVGDMHVDFDAVEAIFNKDYSGRFINPPHPPDTRTLLSQKRSLGSVIRMLTPSDSEFTAEFNAWLESIPQHIRALAFIIKRFYRQEWGKHWREYFSVDYVNGNLGHELKYQGRKLVASYLRIGRERDGTWRLFKLRQDFIASQKVQMADDITVSATLPAQLLTCLNPEYRNQSVKIIENCERFLFQRPDDAIHRGLDKQAESDIAKSDNFLSNFEPKTSDDARQLLDQIINFCEFTRPMQNLIRAAATGKGSRYFVSSAHSRMVNGVPSPNMRYLQLRPDLEDSRATYISRIGSRLARQVPIHKKMCTPVNAVLQGRRNNPPDPEKGIPALAVYNPIHYQPLPELFMEFICSLTGKSPSTTGLGLEGALTKGPFNALSPTADLNNALVSFILCEYHGFSSSAGSVGPHRRVDHDISLLIPEIWCRLPMRDRDPDYLINRGYLEKLEDFDYGGKRVQASRLGYRITRGFVHAYFGKIFDNPMAVFDAAMLKPESQNLDLFVDAIHYIVESQQRVARGYFEDGTIEFACPPLKALLHIMAFGEYQGMDLQHAKIRAMFTRDELLASDWYHQRLSTKQQLDVKLWQKHVQYIQGRLEDGTGTAMHTALQLQLNKAQAGLQKYQSRDYLVSLEGTIGADNLLC